MLDTIFAPNTDFADGYGFAAGNFAVNYVLGLSEVEPDLPGGSLTQGTFHKEEGRASFSDANPNGLKFKGKTTKVICIELDAIASGTATLSYRMRDLVDKLDLSDYIELCDQVENPLYVYHNSDIFCLPSLYEGYPNVICEAMACGLPIVCSNVCDNPLIVENGVGGFLFNPISEENIANALELMINLSKEDKLNMSRHNRRCVVERNSSVVFLDKYLALMKKL